MKREALILALALAMIPRAGAQNPPLKVDDTPDVEYVDMIEPSSITADRKRKRVRGPHGTNWRKYYRLVYNFNAVYPYALVGRSMIAQVDSTIEAGGLEKRERKKYLHKVELELLRLFEDDIWHMTISQGLVLTRLIDRECGISPYEIITDYSSKTAADFWNLVGKLFRQDLKASYDPDGIDRETEELVKIWDRGEFDDLYFSIFGKDPPKVKLPATRLNSK